MTHLPPSRPQDSRPHAVVIGSGFGGLAAAIRLGARGYRVTVLERLDAPGGRASVFRQDGFSFDAGPTIVTAPFLLEELWALAGRRLQDDVELRQLDPFYEMHFANGERFTYYGDAERMRAEVARFSPADVAGYDSYLAACEKIYQTGFEQLGDVPFLHASDMARLAPKLLQLGAMRSVYGMVAKHMRDDRLRTIFSYHPLLVGGNPFTASAIYCLICWLERAHGVHYAMGGTYRLIEGLCSLIASQGGSVRCNTEVTQILVKDGAAHGVRLADGESLQADIVVSNAAAGHTYGTLLSETKRRRWTDRKLARSRYSMGLFVWYFGTRRRYETLRHHTILFGPRYRGLLTDIFQKHHLAEDFSLYLHRPSATDPSVAPEGCDAFYVLSPVPNLAGTTDWRSESEAYRKRIARALHDTVMPGFEREIVTSRVMTPLDFESRLLSPFGAGFDLEPRLTQSAYFRPHNKSEEIDRLYLAGAGTHPGAGIPGVIASAKALDRVVPDARLLV